MSRYSNELNAFRSGIEERTQQHKQKIDAVNQALGIKADKVFDNAKKISDAGSKLMESGIGGGVGATALGKYARKGITAFNKFKSAGQDVVDKATGAVDKAKNAVDDVGKQVQEAGSKVEGKVGDLQQAGSARAGTLEEQSARLKNQLVGNDAESKAQEARDSTVPENETGGANQSVGGNTAEGKVSLDMDEAKEGTQMEAEDKNVGESTETKADTADTAETDIPTPETNVGSNQILPTDSTATADAGGDAAAEATTEATTEVGIDSAAVGLEEGAAATSWLAFLGIPEILAAAGAVAGIVSAGIGISDAVKGGDITAKAQAMPTTVKPSGFSVAGTYVVPTQDSLS